MKKLLITLTVLIFTLSSISAFAGQQYERRNNNLYKKHRQGQQYDSRDFRKPQYNSHHGPNYHYTHRHKNYKYYRHYHWDQWNKIRHDRRYRDGHYHSDNGYLMFSFCDPNNGLCFSISLD